MTLTRNPADVVMARILRLQTQAQLLIEDVAAVGGVPDDITRYAARIESLLSKLEKRLTSHFAVSSALRVGMQECKTCRESFPYTLEYFYGKKKADGSRRLSTTCKVCWNKQTTERSRKRLLKKVLR